MSIDPYDDWVDAYRAAGWLGVLPLPANSKASPPDGYTGASGAWPGDTEIEAWRHVKGAHNIALRMPLDVVGIDVDTYNGKCGLATFLALVERLGHPGATWETTSRDGTPESFSAIRWFRLPPGITSESLRDPGGDIELIRFGHRYAVVPPSIHPDGRAYAWRDQSGLPSETIPTAAMLSELPSAWADALSSATSVTPAGSKSLDLLGGTSHVGTLHDPITTNRDGTLAAFTMSCVKRGFTRDETFALLEVRCAAVVGGDPKWPFARADFERWWKGAIGKVEHAPADVDETTGEPLEGRDLLIAQTIEKMRVQEEARERFTRERADAEFREPPQATLAATLRLADEEVSYAIDGLLSVGGNAVLTAAFKAGKTTMMVNLIRSLADGVAFLGRFKVEPARVAVWDYELSPGQHRRWLRQAGVRNADAVALVNLRGYRIDLTTPRGEDWAVRALDGSTVWILDPYGRALAGADENDNSAVGRFLEALDVIKERAGISELIMPAHTGRKIHEQGAEHARGATRLDDWADARWILTREANNQRFFRADGRDVELEQKAVEFEFGRLTLADWDSGDMKERAFEQAVRPKVLVYIREHPGCVTNRITESVPHKATETRRAIADLLEDGLIHVVSGPGKAMLHYETKAASHVA